MGANRHAVSESDLHNMCLRFRCDSDVVSGHRRAELQCRRTQSGRGPRARALGNYRAFQTVDNITSTVIQMNVQQNQFKLSSSVLYSVFEASNAAIVRSFTYHHSHSGGILRKTYVTSFTKKMCPTSMAVLTLKVFLIETAELCDHYINIRTTAINAGFLYGICIFNLIPLNC